MEAADVHDGICTYRWTISDTGIGMSPEFLSRIFDPFSQEKTDARSVYQGTGLGMAITKGLIEQMNGSIEVTSQVGVGSVFVITIPFEIAEKQKKDEEIAEKYNIRGLHLLAAEDNELNAEIIEMLLTDDGAKVTVAKNGRQAVEYFESNSPGTFDAILMDVMMPVMDGIAATKAIRAMDRADAKTIPIIAMTANAFEEDAKRCLEWLVDGEGKNYYTLVSNWADNFSNYTEDNKESLYEIHFSLTNKVGFDQTDNYLDPNAQLGTQIEMNQAPTGIGWNNIEARRWLVDYYKREQTTDGKNDSRLFYTLWYDGAASDFPEYPNQLIYGSPWNSDWGNRVFIKKYSTDASPLYYWNDNNFRSLRYADMLLLYAEALNELNATPPSKAIECLNRVRNRVNLPNIEDSKYYNGSQISTNKDAFREHLKIERALELAMECVRWVDLKRWGINDQTTLNELKARDSDFNNFIIGKSIRMPIPQSEVDNNPNLNQNDQY